MREIPLRGGKVAFVSDHRYDEISQCKWYEREARNTFYAVNNTGLLMHQMVLEPKKGFVTDHIDNNGLNNQDENLRHLTNSENIRRGNPGRPNRGTGHRGIQFIARNKKNPYRAELRFQGVTYHVGYFGTLELAIEARAAFLAEQTINESQQVLTADD